VIISTLGGNLNGSLVHSWVETGSVGSQLIRWSVTLYLRMLVFQWSHAQQLVAMLTRTKNLVLLVVTADEA